MQRRDRSYAERQLRVTNYELQVTNAETPKLEARKMERVRGGLRVAERLALTMPRYGTAQEQWHTSSALRSTVTPRLKLVLSLEGMGWDGS